MRRRRSLLLLCTAFSPRGYARGGCGSTGSFRQPFEGLRHRSLRCRNPRPCGLFDRSRSLAANNGGLVAQQRARRLARGHHFRRLYARGPAARGRDRPAAGAHRLSRVRGPQRYLVFRSCAERYVRSRPLFPRAHRPWSRRRVHAWLARLDRRYRRSTARTRCSALLFGRTVPVSSGDGARLSWSRQS